MNNKIFSISGYGWSGSGLVVDILKFNKVGKALDVEFTLLSEPDGILDLYYALVENKHFIKSDLALNRFVRFAKLIAGKKSLLNPFGLGLNDKLPIDFEKHVNRYIGNLSEFSYYSKSRVNFHDYDSLHKYMKILQYYITGKNSKKYLFGTLEKEVFIESTTLFLHSILSLDKDSIILDQAVPISNLEIASQILPSAVFITVDRDPRDVFVDLKETGGLIGNELKNINKEAVQKFIHWYKRSRYISQSERVASNFSFENIVYNLGQDRARLNELLGFDLFVKYDMTKSKHNVGMWKHYENREIFDFIKNEINYAYRD